MDHGSPAIQQACLCIFVEAAELRTYHSENTSAWICSNTLGVALGLNKLPHCPIQLLPLQRLLNGIKSAAQPAHSLIHCYHCVREIDLLLKEAHLAGSILCLEARTLPSFTLVNNLLRCVLRMINITP